MKSEKEKIFENHIVKYLTDIHSYTLLSNSDCTDKEYHFVFSILHIIVLSINKTNHLKKRLVHKI